MILACFILAMVSADKQQQQYYRTLGISPSATSNDIKAAYRALVLKHHPDKALGDQRKATERFKRIVEAYDTLSDPKKRKLYDLQMSNPRRYSSTYPSQPFGFEFQGHPELKAHPTRRIMKCTLEEILMGVEHVECLRDSPWRRVLDALESLRKVNSVEEVMQLEGIDAVGRMSSVLLTIFLRKPSILFGQPFLIRFPLALSAYCFLVALQLPPSPAGEYKVQLKPGWRGGTKLTFRRNGRKICFELREKRHRIFERQKHDLLWRYSVARRKARRGFTVRVPLLGSEEPVLLEMGPGEALDGDQKILQGQGMPIRGGPDRGDLIIQWRVT